MKILKLDDITGAASMPLKKGTLQFLQDSYKEAINALGIGLVGSSYNPNTVYALSGCINTGVSGGYVISSGAVFYQGEVYLVDAVSFTPTGTDTAILDLDIENYSINADPVTFTDTTTHSIHNIRKVTIGAGSSGTGTLGGIDYSQVSFLPTIWPKVNLSGAGVTGSYPNFVIPGASGLNPALYAGTFHIGNPSGGQTYNIPFLNPDNSSKNLGTSSYYVMGNMLSNASNPSWDANGFFRIIKSSKSPTGFSLYYLEGGNWTQDLDYDFIIFAI